MVTQQLIEYIKNQQQLGKTKEEITQALLGQVWQAGDVEQGFSSASSGAVAMAINSELPKARQIFNEAWGIYKRLMKTLVLINLTPALSILLFGLIFGLYFAAKTTDHGNPGSYFGLGVLFLVAIGIMIYLSIWSTAAGLTVIKDQAENIGWKEAFVRSRAKIGIFFLASLLTGLAVMGGLILFIIPGIIFGLWFSQVPYIVIEEGLTNTAALKRSKYYVQGRIGEVFGKMFYIGIITFGLYIGLGILLAIFDAVLGLKSQYTSWIGNVFSVVWTPMITVYAYQLYKYLKRTRP